MVAEERIFVVACGVLNLDIRKVAEDLGIKVGTRFLEGGLHENPTRLRQEVQAVIDQVSGSGSWDRIAVGYGICGRGTVDLRARDIPLAIPKVHDCISLFLGGNAAYRREFKRYPGTYYISAGWFEEKTEPLTQKRPYIYMGDNRVYYDELVEKYGEQHANETFDFFNSWKRNYQRAAFIDTGAGERRKYADYTRQMAEKYGWKYDALGGDLRLLNRLLTSKRSTNEVLIVPPGQVTVFDSKTATLDARPTASASGSSDTAGTGVEVLSFPHHRPGRKLRIGLGIDAGGTYTDAVLYDLKTAKMLCKHKALTTKWDFTVGIREALAGLEQKQLMRSELVALSTTLATNAIVEGDGQKVGLLIMPPYGLFDNRDIAHEPKALIAGSLEITGKVIAPVDEAGVRQTARRMIDRMGVSAFAVSGFAGSINPAHEMQVKRAVTEETGCFVSCGHELSDLLNFKTRAETAVLNARIVPRLVTLLNDLKSVLASSRVQAPVMVVKGDGSLMSSRMALERPVETILSGPAASVAGARFLTGAENALVVDMGGTTTDTAALENARVRVEESGSQVGKTRTHVKALAIRTTGLGGDSLIAYEKGEFNVGPRRVAPMAWLGSSAPEFSQAMGYLERTVHEALGSSKYLQVFTMTGHRRDLALSDSEARIVSLLAERPHALGELAQRSGSLYPGAMPLKRLEEHHLIQRCGLTPTDLLHVKGRFDRWDTATSDRICRLFARIAGLDTQEMVDMLLEKVARQMALELIKKQLDEETSPDEMEDCEVCRVMTDAMLSSDGKRGYSVDFKLHSPVIGIGAPIGYFLPRAAAMVGAEAILPQDADVANAIGAITSQIAVQRQLKIRPDQDGGFIIEGLAGARRFKNIASAQAHAKEALGRRVRDMARAAGTSQSTVEIIIEDRTSRTSTGEELFLERSLTARLEGRPDLPLSETKGKRGMKPAGAQLKTASL